MIYEHKGIPTTYKGIKFRSQLEATWANFFDKIGIEWQYEPINLNGYVPDFFIKLHGKPMLVEVKPIMFLGQEMDNELKNDIDNIIKKVRKTGYAKEFFILGTSPCLGQGSNNDPILGIVCGCCFDPYTGGDDNFSYDYLVWFKCRTCAKLSFRQDIYSYACYRNGCYDGMHHLIRLNDPENEDIINLNKLFFESKNEFQYQPRGTRN